MAVTGSFALLGWQAQASAPDVLRVRQITVVDANGVERVWIGAPVPDPIVEGQRGKRKGPASGMILLDADGDERGGFLTSDGPAEVWIGLDSKKGQRSDLLGESRRWRPPVVVGRGAQPGEAEPGWWP